MSTKTRFFTAMAFTVLALAVPVHATEVVTTSLPSWTPTTSSDAEWNFVFPGNGSYNTAAGYSLNTSSGSFGATAVTGPDGTSYSLNKTTTYGNSGNLTALQAASDGTGSMVFTTAANGLTAFGLGLGLSGTAAPITVTLSDGETFTVSPGVNGNAFLGLSSATAITSFTLTTTSGSNVDLTDFFAGASNEPADSSPAAEVTTALMIGSGLLIFGARRRVFSNFTAPRLSSYPPPPTNP